MAPTSPFTRNSWFCIGSYFLLLLSDPIPVQGIPGAVLVGTFALLADKRRADFPCIPPIPAHCSQVVTAGRLEANGTIFPFSKATLPHAPLK